MVYAVQASRFSDRKEDLTTPLTPMLCRVNLREVNPVLNQQELKELLHYDPKTGIFRWKKTRGCVKSGAIAGSTQNTGYWRIRVNTIEYLAHRLAHLYMTGEWPKEQMDHINLNKRDNCWRNLRAATPAQNQHNTQMQRNNTSGFKGVFAHPDGKYRAELLHNGKKAYLGYFATAEEAHKAYCKAADELHGEFANHGA